MRKKNSAKPTEAELDVLRILWEYGPSTVKAVNNIQNRDKDVGYTTTLKIMQIMSEKGMLKRTKTGRSHVYQPVLQQEKMQRQLLDSFVDAAFSGSSAKLVMQALGHGKASKEEIRQIREYLDRLEKGEKP
jgi:predicted transcriptional regulator